jgi:squalene-hopene/tetraprenyl-beta-curcumene cyclase
MAPEPGVDREVGQVSRHVDGQADGQADGLAIEQAVARARAFLIDAAAGGFAEARHDMTFPHALGFTGAQERQQGDIFSRAVLGAWLLDIAEARGGDARLEGIAAAQADHVAGQRLADCEGGWSYFPGLPELPPDLDTLGATIELFARAAPQHLPLCEGPIRLALSQRAADGSIRTFLIGDGDPAVRRQAMLRGVELYWGHTADADAMARFHLGLLRLDPARYAPAAPLDWLAAQQDADGAWRVPWYEGAHYGTQLCAALFERLAPDHPAAVKAAHFLTGPPQPPATATTNAMTLALSGIGAAARAARASTLAALQEPDGSWAPSPWIRMPMGRPGGAVTRVLTWQSRTITTALCLRALVAG